MGPRLFSRGDVPVRARVSAPSRLQWGHGFSAVETRPAAAPRRRPWCFNGATAFQPWRRRGVRAGAAGPGASMGPRLFSRGDLDDHAGEYLAAWASMGPRLFSRGDAE